MVLQNRSLFRHLLFRQSLCLSAVALVLPTVLMPAAEVQAAEVQAKIAGSQRLAGRPRNASNSSEGGGIRSECPTGTKSLRALMVNSDPGNTTQDHPTFWFYLPFGKQTYTPKNQTRPITVSKAKFSLLDENLNYVARPIVLPLPDQAGVVRFTLPSSVKPLEVGQNYQWFFELVCGDRKAGGSSNPKISGWIVRVPTDAKLTQQLKSTAAPNQYKVFQANQLWFESVTHLADQRSQVPDAWKALLAQFGLQDFAPNPIVDLRPVLQPPALQRPQPDR